MVFAEHLKKVATLPSNLPAGHKEVPTVGFIAHLDTSPDMSGRHVAPRIVQNYQGGDIELNSATGSVLSPNDFPELNNYVGQDLIVTDGNTLLGADDKAGIAEIITAMDYLLKHPEVKHGKIRVGFNPYSDFAYTMDGGEIGELEYENFNAAVSRHLQGPQRSPRICQAQDDKLDAHCQPVYNHASRWETPEHTEDYEGLSATTTATASSAARKSLSISARKINHEFPDCCSTTSKTSTTTCARKSNR